MKFKNVEIDEQFAADFFNKLQHEQVKIMNQMSAEQLEELGTLVTKIATVNIKKNPMIVRENI
jgi:hypothetical protein